MRELPRRSVYGTLFVLLVVVAAMSPPAAQQAAEEGPSLSVQDHGVGTGVDAEQRKLLGEADSFAEGVKVWFWTRVLGGSGDDRIYHVWIHEDKEVLRIGLKVGGSHWRTWSNKQMHRGSLGEWRAEVHDEQGNVLASARFACTPPSDPSSD